MQNNFFTFSYGCENWFLTLKEELKLQVFGNNIRKIFVIKKEEVTEYFKILCIEELCDLYGSGSVVVARRA